MLLYLATKTCPDIAFAVSQVSRFNYTPKQNHATAIKATLHCASDKGTIICPTGTLQLDCYVDADFAGLHGCEPF